MEGYVSAFNRESPMRLRIAVQKSGRLSERTFELFDRCGLSFEWGSAKLFLSSESFPIDLMKVRDDDIPGYVAEGVCDLGIVGLNVLRESELRGGAGSRVVMKMGFGGCRLALAVPQDLAYDGVESLQGKRIATSYPGLLGSYLAERGVRADVLPIHGSVEIAPTLRIADAICDLVSSGATLRSNGLVEVATVLESQSVLVASTRDWPAEKQSHLDRLLQRIRGVLSAESTKYIMMNAPRDRLDAIRRILPGMEDPSILPLQGDPTRVAVHAVAREEVFWETMERLKEQGATSILVLPIEKVIS
jgi:ATP phosphoribosyltransferase